MDKNVTANDTASELEIITKVKFTDYELFRRLNDMTDELDMTADEIINIAVDKYLDDFHEHMRLWQCRKSAFCKKEFKRADNRDVF
jgi:hypothetical protein